ncbi:MAG: DsrE/DsrF/DrsH-like family protein [Sphingomonas sp.]|nr:DsrE/DsrF/DrsH-like family protein [Sphingomonas sp.]
MTLAIMLVTEDSVRARAALSVALAHVALGGRVRIYAHERAVALFAQAPRLDDETETLAAAGLPDRLAMLAMAIESGVELIACQTGLAIAGLSIGELVLGTEPGGLVALLATLGDDRLVSV